MRINLKIFRLKKQMTQTEISNKLKCSRATYAAIENGVRSGRMKFWNDLQNVFDLENSEMWELMKDE